MSKEQGGRLDAYYAEAASWAVDRQVRAARMQRIAWGVAAGAVFVAVAEAIALMALAPLKTVVPYTLLVDRQTGHVQTLDPAKGESISPNEALTRSFLVQYVIARESFVIETIQQNYRKAVLLSDGAVKDAYVARMQASNPLSPLAVYPRRTVLETQIRSVSLLNANTAAVRFQTVRIDPGAQPRIDGTWFATVTYRYSNEPMTAEQRLLNPLGFKVTKYHKDVELIPEEISPPARPVEAARARALSSEADRPAPDARGQSPRRLVPAGSTE